MQLSVGKVCLRSTLSTKQHSFMLYNLNTRLKIKTLYYGVFVCCQLYLYYKYVFIVICVLVRYAFVINVYVYCYILFVSYNTKLKCFCYRRASQVYKTFKILGIPGPSPTLVIGNVGYMAKKVGNNTLLTNNCIFIAFSSFLQWFVFNVYIFLKCDLCPLT